MTTRMLHRALGALLMTAACSGGDPPGGGNDNGDTDGGGKTDGTTGNGGRNPLIDAIPGCWEIVSVNCEREHESFPEPVTVNPTDPSCGTPSQNPPGDACINWFRTSIWLVLDGDVVRHRNDQLRSEGHVLEGGHRIVYTDEECPGYEVPCEVEPTRRDEIDARWVSAGTRDEFGNLRCNDPLDDEAEPRCAPTE